MSRNLEITNPISVCLIGDPGSTIKMCKVRGEAKMLYGDIMESMSEIAPP